MSILTLGNDDSLPMARGERPPSLRPNVVAGIAVIVLGFGGFLLWGYTTRLDSAAVASGTVIVDSRVKTITHLEGGILKQLLVEEGDRVTAGQPLLQLDDTQAQSTLRQLQARRTGYIARIARFRAEQAGLATIDFPEELLGASDEYGKQILTNETMLFESRRDTLDRSIGALQSSITSFDADARSAAEQLNANAAQQKLAREQLRSFQTLFNEGLTTRAQLSAVETGVSELEADASALVAARSRAEQGRAQAEVEISRTRTAWQSEVADALQSSQIELSTIEDAMASASDILRRVVVVAPEDGVVANILVRTPGGVIGGGQPILDIVPESSSRTVEARLDPRDIDSVHVGAKVRVRLTAYGSRQMTPIDGVLSYVAADQMVDQRTSASYYVVRATVDEQSPASERTLTLNAGEPAELLILNRPRLAIDYILAPFADSLQRAFREE
jgi:HlyD family secretion protein